jgi:superfamily II DNA helicase RecQ
MYEVANNSRNVMVKAGTSMGKLLMYQGLAIAFPLRCILVVSPLTALMEDQVKAAQELGISAVSLDSEGLRKTPAILQAAANGQYQIVYATAEFLSHPASKFPQLVDTHKGGSAKFAKTLLCVVVDEVHLVRQWKGFREDYKKIGTIRARLPKTPILACLGTLPGYVRMFCHTSLSLNRPSLCLDMGWDGQRQRRGTRCGDGIYWKRNWNREQEMWVGEIRRKEQNEVCQDVVW